MNHITDLSSVRHMRYDLRGKLSPVLVHLLSHVLLLDSDWLPDVIEELGLGVHELKWEQELVRGQDIDLLVWLACFDWSIVLSGAQWLTFLGKVTPPQRSQINTVWMQILLNPSNRLNIDVLVRLYLQASTLLNRDLILKALKELRDVLLQLLIHFGLLLADLYFLVHLVGCLQGLHSVVDAGLSLLLLLFFSVLFLLGVEVHELSSVVVKRIVR